MTVSIQNYPHLLHTARPGLCHHWVNLQEWRYPCHQRGYVNVAGYAFCRRHAKQAQAWLADMEQVISERKAAAPRWVECPYCAGRGTIDNAVWSEDNGQCWDCDGWGGWSEPAHSEPSPGSDSKRTSPAEGLA